MEGTLLCYPSLLPLPHTSPLSSFLPPPTMLPSCHTLPVTFLPHPSLLRPPATSLCQALSESEKAKFMYPCDPWEARARPLSETAAAAATALAATAGISVAAAAATAPAATAAFSMPATLRAPMLAPVLQRACSAGPVLQHPSVEEQRSLEYSIKLKEYEIQLQQLRILQTQLQESAAAQCAAPKHALAVAAVAAPCAVPIHMHPAPGTAPIHVLAVPTGPSYSPTNTSPSFPPGSTVPSYTTTSQGYDTTSQGYDTSSPSYSPSFPPGTVPSYDTSSPSFSPSSPNFLPTSASYDPNSPIHLQTMPSSSRTTSCTRTGHPHEPPSCSPGYAFAPATPPSAVFDGAATPDAPTAAPTISVLSIDLMGGELEEMLTEALEQMTDDQAGK